MMATAAPSIFAKRLKIKLGSQTLGTVEFDKPLEIPREMVRQKAANESSQSASAPSDGKIPRVNCPKDESSVLGSIKHRLQHSAEPQKRRKKDYERSNDEKRNCPSSKSKNHATDPNSEKQGCTKPISDLDISPNNHAAVLESRFAGNISRAEEKKRLYNNIKANKETNQRVEREREAQRISKLKMQTHALEKRGLFWMKDYVVDQAKKELTFKEEREIPSLKALPAVPLKSANAISNAQEKKRLNNKWKAVGETKLQDKWRSKIEREPENFIGLTYRKEKFSVLGFKKRGPQDSADGKPSKRQKRDSEYSAAVKNGLNKARPKNLTEDTASEKGHAKPRFDVQVPVNKTPHAAPIESQSSGTLFRAQEKKCLDIKRKAGEEMKQRNIERLKILREREAARMAILKVEAAVEVEDHLMAERELEKLCGWSFCHRRAQVLEKLGLSLKKDHVVDEAENILVVGEDTEMPANKALRAALLKIQFADAISRAQEKKRLCNKNKSFEEMKQQDKGRMRSTEIQRDREKTLAFREDIEEGEIIE